MVKRLKRKFVLINMTCIISILIVVIAFICFFTYRSELKNSLEYLEKQLIIYESGGREQSPFDDENGNIPPEFNKPEKPIDLPNMFTFTVKSDKDGNILEASLTGIDYEIDDLKEAIKLAIGNQENRGKLKSIGLLFAKMHTQNGYVFAFASIKPLESTMQSTLTISILCLAGAILLFFIVSERLAEYAIKPVAFAWEKQKQFVADASHDLKTPLTVILANNDILLSRKDKTIAEEIKWVESSMEEASKMKGLVEKLLDLAKSDSYIGTLEMAEANISDATEGAILQLEPIAYEKSLSIDSSIGSNIIIKTNLEAYLRIVQILIDNAIKYSPKGGKITIRLWEDRQRCYLATNNAGYLSEDSLEHIFERFYRADKARGDDGGHGLGLAIAKSLSLALNGTLTAKSSKEMGTSFILSIKK